MTLTIDPANAEQLEAWDGDEGAYWAEHADEFDRSIADHHERLMAAAAIGPHDRVLDVGCGTGRTTRDAAGTATAGEALGVDLSSAMLEIARKRAADEGIVNASFEQADAQVHPFDAGAFDVVLGRTAAMFFADQGAAFANLERALRPGGRLVQLTWQPLDRNEWARSVFASLAAGRDLPAPPPDRGPFSLGDPDRVRSLLTGAGFVDVELESVEEPMWFGDDADAATGFIVGLMGWMLEGLGEADRARATGALHDVMAAHETPVGVLLGSAAWITTARRRPPRSGS